MKPIPFFYFPTTLHLVDDRPRFPSSVKNYLTNSSQSFFYTRPLEFVEKINQIFSHDRTFTPLLEAMKNTLLYGKTESLLTTLQQYLQNTARFNEPAVVTIDYSMAPMNGLEVSKALPLLLKKILLTGEADHTIALGAFNEGVIDRFIRKDADSLPAQIANAILELSLDYFADIAQNIMVDPDIKRFIPNYLGQATFRKIFIELWQHYQGVEFYLLNSEGDFLCLTAQGKAFQLAFRDAPTLMLFTKQVTQAHLEEPTDESEIALSKLIARDSLLVFPFTEDENTLPTQKWQTCLYDLKPLSLDDETLYYAYVPLDDITFKTNTSLMQYQQSL